MAITTELDVSARSGLLLAAYAAGRSTEPNLLTRGTPDQAIITGIAAASGYGWGVSVSSLLRSVADRVPLPSRLATPLVNVAAAAGGLAAQRALDERSSGSAKSAVARLAASGVAVAASAGAVADVLEWVRGRRGGRVLAFGAMAATGIAAWSRTRPGRATFGSQLPDGEYFEDTPRELSVAKTGALGATTAVLLFGAAHGESALASAVAKGAARVLGGSPDDHRTIGRIGATATSFGLGWLAVSGVTAKLTGAGTELDTADVDPPTLPEVTGSPASGVAWEKQSREGARWLSEVLLADGISAVMAEPAKQPIRVYASLPVADSPEERAQLLLDELDRTRAFERKYIALFSPTGSGYVNYVASETFEYLARGDCASMAIAYSVLPSALSLTRTDLGTRQTQMVVAGVTERLMALPAERRPKFFIFGESLGCKVSEEMFSGASDLSLRGAGIEAGVWVGTPAFTKWRQRVWGGRPQDQPPGVEPGAIYTPRAVSDWHELADAERAKVKYLLLQNGDDPVPKFEAPLLWRRPDWLGPEGTRPPGAPTGTSWLPVVTFVATFTDLMNALTPTPGTFQEGGHDYRLEIPAAIQQVWGLPATAEQMTRVNDALRQRELAWELKRDWEAAAHKQQDKVAAAEAKVAKEAATWTGDSADQLTEQQIQDLIDRGVEPGTE